MPKLYSDEEKKNIIAKLKKEANTLMQEKGVKKTTVDELVKRVGIPKGSFYLFYPSKEMLLFEVLQDYNLLPYWGEAWDEYKHLEFKPQKISHFSYSLTLCSNPIAKSIINTLSGKQLYYYSDSSYDLAEQYFDEKLEINEQSNFSFNEIVSTISMLKQNNYIKINPLELSDETILDNGELIPPQIAYVIDFTI